MSWKDKKRKRHQSDHHRHRNDRNTQSQCNDINRLIEEGLRQQREKAEKEAETQQTASTEPTLSPPKEVSVDMGRKEDSFRYTSMRSHVCGNILDLYLRRQQGLHSSYWKLLRNNLPIFRDEYARTSLNEDISELLSHNIHGIAYLNQRTITFTAPNQATVTIDNAYSDPMHLAWCMDDTTSIAATLYHHMNENCLTILHVNAPDQSYATQTVHFPTHIQHQLHWEYVHTLQWGFANHQLMSIDTKGMKIFDIEHVGLVSKIWFGREKTVHCTAVSKNTLLGNPCTQSLLIGQRNGSIHHVDLRSGNGSSPLMLHRMPYCIDDIHCLPQTAYHYLVKDICGNIHQFDIRLPDRHITSTKKTIAQPSSPCQVICSATATTAAPKIMKSRCWSSNDNEVIVTYQEAAIQVYHRRGRRLMKSVDVRRMVAEREAEGEGDGVYRQCRKVLFAKEVGTQPAEKMHVMVAMQDNRPAIPSSTATQYQHHLIAS